MRGARRVLRAALALAALQVCYWTSPSASVPGPRQGFEAMLCVDRGSSGACLQAAKYLRALKCDCTVVADVSEIPLWLLPVASKTATALFEQCAKRMSQRPKFLIQHRDVEVVVPKCISTLPALALRRSNESAWISVPFPDGEAVEAFLKRVEAI
jgi:hypothetical protein